MIEYWHWHTLPYGAETYWGGVLPHSLEPGRVYTDVSEIGAQLSALGDALDGYEPDADVAILWSNPSRYALQFMPPLSTDGRADDESYEQIVDSFYRGVHDAGLQTRVLHVEQAVALGAEALAERFPVLVAAGLYIATENEIEFLRDYAAAGGHLVLGPRTAYADEEARARVAIAPAGLSVAAGVHYEEFSNLESDVRVEGTSDLPLSDGASAGRWIDGLIADGATVLARYRHPRFSTFPAVTTHPHERGRITTVGTVPNAELASDIIRFAAPDAPRSLVSSVGDAVTVASGTAGGSRFWFVFNWGWEPQCVRLQVDAVDTVSGANLTTGSEIELSPWDVRVLRTTEGH